MRSTDRCGAKNPTGEQCQLKAGHRRAHEVRRPNERSQWVYRWGRDTAGNEQ